MMSLRKLPGVAEVAMQAGLHAGRRVRSELRARDPTGPFEYRDLGSAAYIARGRAVVSAGPLHVGGFPGWVLWLFIHIAFLTGFRNRVGAILTWSIAFTRDSRRERAFTTKSVGLRRDIYKPMTAWPWPPDGNRRSRAVPPSYPPPHVRGANSNNRTATGCR